MASATNETLRRLLRLCDLLSDPSLLIHPIHCGRKDIIELANLIISDPDFPILSFELFNYIYYTMSSLSLARRAYFSDPLSPRLILQIIEKNHNLASAWKYRSNLLQNFEYTSPKAYFTPLMLMAIGHYGLFLDYLEAVFPRLQAAENVTLFSSHYGIGQELLSLLQEKYFFLTIVDAEQVALTHSISQLSNAYDCNPTTQFLSFSQRKMIASAVESSLQKSTRLKSVVHLRTSSFKNDSKSYGMEVRSVNPTTYASIVKLLKERNWKTIQVTADNVPVRIPGADLCHVTDSKSAFEQWRIFGDSSFIIGTQSGISHLTALVGFNALITNHISLPFERLLSRQHMIACKRVSARPNLCELTKSEIIFKFIEPWVQTANSLAHYVDILDLSSDELESACSEYLSILDGGETLYTFDNALRECHLENFIGLYPCWNLFSCTYLDFVSLLNDAC